MTKYQQNFFEYLTKLEEEEEKYDEKYVEIALKELWKYWKHFNKDGVKDSLQMAMNSVVGSVGMPVQVHLN